MLGEARGGCDAQDASQFSGTARRVLCFVEDGERRFHAPEVLGACFGQRQGARATCEEHRAELPLQSRDDARGRRLGKSEVAGSTRETPRARDAHENPQGGHALSHRVLDSFTGQIYLSPPRPLLAEPSRVHIRMQPNATKTFLQRSTPLRIGMRTCLPRTVRQTYLSWYEEHKT